MVGGEGVNGLGCELRALEYTGKEQNSITRSGDKNLSELLSNFLTLSVFIVIFTES